MSARRPPRIFGRRRWVLEDENRSLRAALREVMHAVAGIDPNPRPWSCYASSDAARFTLNVEQRVWLAESEPDPARRHMWPTPPGQVEVWIDNLRYVVDPATYTGAQIRRFAHPPIGPDRDLYLARPNPWDADLRIGDDTEVHLQAGAEFFTARRYVNAG